MAQPAGFLSQDNRTDMGIPVFWTTANSDPPWNFRIWLDQFFLAVTVKESVDPELLLQEPKEVLLEQLPRPKTPREHKNAQAIADREARDQLARDKINLENEERRARGPKVGHNVYYIEVQKRVASRLFLALVTEGKKKFVQKNPHVEVSKLEFREMVALAKVSFDKSQSVTYERYKLFNRSQETGETLEAFHAALTAQDLITPQKTRHNSRKSEYKRGEQLMETENPLSLDNLFDKSLLAELVSEDTWMDRLRRVVERNDRHSFELMGPYTNPLWHQMSVVDDCLLVDNRLAVPEKLRQAVLRRLHQGHPGQEAMLEVSNYLWWPHMHKDIVNMAEECRSCTRYGKNAKYLIPKNSAKPLPLLSQPGQELQLDYAGPLEDHKGKKIYLLVAIDRYSKFPSVKVTKSTGGKSTIKFLRTYIDTHGIPESIKTDQFSGFRGKAMKKILHRK